MDDLPAAAEGLPEGAPSPASLDLASGRALLASGDAEGALAMAEQAAGGAEDGAA